MENFQFHLDSKVTTWYRTHFDIDANSLEEAREKAIVLVKSGNINEIPWEQIDETTEGMTPEDNGGMSTEELYDEQTQIIYHNGKI